jgi:NAD(P)-dependent dehydrogenase (short-subunit alcohol dehydrogenase family)
MSWAVITGACGGIGRALCDVFAEAGYSVLGVDCKTEGSFRHPLITFDITTLRCQTDATHRFISQIDQITGGTLDALVNNAAKQIVKPFNLLTSEDWQSTLDTNLLAPFWMIQTLHSQLKKAQGAVVNIASIHANLTKKNFSAYAASKGALVTMTKALSLELAPEVRINAILPAATDTPMLREGFSGSPERFQSLEKFHPVGRIATPREIAKVALFLAGKDSGFITGSALNVDGGIGCCLSDPR